MSNKKLFWLVFIVLSICEFGQFAYSQNTSLSDPQSKAKYRVLQCDTKQTLMESSAVTYQLANYSLPR